MSVIVANWVVTPPGSDPVDQAIATIPSAPRTNQRSQRVGRWGRDPDALVCSPRGCHEIDPYNVGEDPNRLDDHSLARLSG